MREPKGQFEILLTGEFFDTDNFYVHTPKDFADLERLTTEMTDRYKKEPRFDLSGVFYFYLFLAIMH